MSGSAVRPLYVRSDPSQPFPDKAVIRYRAQVQKAGPDECWPWTGASDKGYGVISIESRQWRAHRVAYTLVNGAIPTGMVVRHRCDNPPCVNPAHLVIGTQADNLQDAITRGRAHRARGSACPVSRLTESAVMEARGLHAEGGHSYRALARRYGVSYVAMRCAIRGDTWSHV